MGSSLTGWVPMVDECRLAIRRLVRLPGFTFTITATLALGIGVNVAVFSVLNAVFLQPLPYRAPDRLVSVTYRGGEAQRFSTTVPYPALHAWTSHARTFEHLAAYREREETLRLPGGEPVRVSVGAVSPNFFAALGVSPVSRGRGFEVSDYPAGSQRVMILSHDFWQRRFGAADEIIGHRFSYSIGAPEVIGVGPRGFRFPGFATPDVLVPLGDLDDASVVRFAQVIGRLRPEVARDDAQQELRTIDEEEAATYPVGMRTIFGTDGRPEVTLLQTSIAGNLRLVLLLVFGAVSMILLLTCANVASLLLVRTAGRQHELATRAALGATPGRLMLSVVVETLVLTVLGAVAGLLALSVTLNGLQVMLAPVVPHAETIALDYRVLVFTAGATIVTAILCFGPTATLVRRSDLIGWLKSPATGAPRPVVREALRTLLIVGQVAMAMTMLIGGLLTARTLSGVTSVALGFQRSGKLTFKIPALSLRGEPAGATETLVDIVDRIRLIPRVSAAGATYALPFAGDGPAVFALSVEGGPPPPPDVRDGSAVIPITSGYFRALGVGISAGRDFEARDGSLALPVAIVNRAFVDQYLGDRDPIGKRLTSGRREIVGVVDNLRQGRVGGLIDEDQRPTIYVPFSQTRPWLGWATASLVLSTETNPRELAEPVRKAVATVAPNAVVFDVRTMDERLAAFVLPERQRAKVFGIFAVAALALAAMGLYSLLGYTVALEMRDFGVRLTLGASRIRLFHLIVWRGLKPVLAGIVLGLACALVLVRALESYLYGVTATDMPTYAVAAAVMAGVAFIACVVPAWRAISVDPLVVLRIE